MNVAKFFANKFNSSSPLVKSCFAISMCLSTALAQALNTTIILHADSDVTPGNAELVTFGLPLAEGDVASVSQIKVMRGATELGAYVEAGLRHHWSDNSLRSVTVQLDGIDMTAGDVELQITDEGSSVARINERPHSEGWASANATKLNLSYPRIFVLHDKAYLATTGLIPPYEPSTGSSDAFEQYQLGQFENWAGGLDYGDSSGANWLFDRSSAMFKAYMTTGRVEFLKEAFLGKQFYFQHVRNDGSTPAAAGGSGCWTYGSTACADGKYIAPQQAKLAWALTGDNSQWNDSLIVNMALQSDLGWNQYATRDPFDQENEGFTERGAGMAGLAEINAYEMTGNSTLLTHLNERIASLKDMQQTVKAWDATNGWAPKSGGWTHNIDVHEGNHNEASAPLSDTDARGFSAWMTENIVDFLWQAYWITGNTDAPEMLRLAANAVDTYGFSSTYNAVTTNHDKKPAFNAVPDYPRAQGCNRTRQDTDILYMASAHASNAGIVQDDWYPYYSDNHNIETVLTLGAGYYFETDAATKTRLKARIDKLIYGWVHSGCTTIFSGVYRLFNWQHRSNSVRSWYWIAEDTNAGGTEEVVIVSPPAAPSSFSILVSGGSTPGGETGGN